MRDFICQDLQLHFQAAVNQVCPCLWLQLPIGKRSGWNIGIAPLGWEDACFSMFVHVTLPTTLPINAALTNLPHSGNHIFKQLKGVCSPWPTQWPSSGSHLQPPCIEQHIESTLYSHAGTRMLYISSSHSICHILCFYIYLYIYLYIYIYI